MLKHWFDPKQRLRERFPHAWDAAHIGAKYQWGELPYDHNIADAFHKVAQGAQHAMIDGTWGVEYNKLYRNGEEVVTFTPNDVLRDEGMYLNRCRIRCTDWIDDRVARKLINQYVIMRGAKCYLHRVKRHGAYIQCATWFNEQWFMQQPIGPGETIVASGIIKG